MHRMKAFEKLYKMLCSAPIFLKWPILGIFPPWLFAENDLILKELVLSFQRNKKIVKLDAQNLNYEHF